MIQPAILHMKFTVNLTELSSSLQLHCLNTVGIMIFSQCWTFMLLVDAEINMASKQEQVGSHSICKIFLSCLSIVRIESWFS